MKQLFFLLFSLPLPLFAQYKTTPIGKVTYQHETSTAADMDLNGPGTLLFNADHSLYIHEGAPDRDSSYNNETYIMGKVIGDPEGFPIYKNHREQRMTCRIFCHGMAQKKAKHCLISDTLGTIDWKIESDTKIFGAYTCQKAVGKFRNRVYEVWFAPDIPIPSGPFKLSGLPGLILEAKSTDGKVKFTFVKLETGEKVSGDIKVPAGWDIQMSYGQFEETSEKRSKEQLEQSAAKGIQGMITHGETIEREYKKFTNFKEEESKH
jgi:GLPGLI family protein